MKNRSGKLVVVAVLAVIAAGVALFAIRPKPQTALSSNLAVNRNPAHALPGRTLDSRRKIDPGMTAPEVLRALGEPSEKLESRGEVVSSRWNYLYSDGNLAVRLREGRVTQIDTTIY